MDSGVPHSHSVVGSSHLLCWPPVLYAPHRFPKTDRFWYSRWSENPHCAKNPACGVCIVSAKEEGRAPWVGTNGKENPALLAYRRRPRSITGSRHTEQPADGVVDDIDATEPAHRRAEGAENGPALSRRRRL